MIKFGEEYAFISIDFKKSDREGSIEIQIANKKNINVTISMGLAEFGQEENGEELFKRADSALYEAKESGRNRVCISKNV